MTLLENRSYKDQAGNVYMVVKLTKQFVWVRQEGSQTGPIPWKMTEGWVEVT